MNMRKLHLNPHTFEAMLMQNCAHHMVETMPCKPSMIAQHLYHFIDTGIAHWLSNIVPARKHLQFLQDLNCLR